MKRLALTMLLFVVTHAQAETLLDLPVARTVFVSGAKVNVRAIANITSHAGEEKLDFLKTAAKSLDTFTEINGVEGCANICYSTESKQWSVSLVTVNAHAVCLVDGHCAHGFTRTGEYIHSHPSGRYRVNRTDKAFLSSYVKLGMPQKGHGTSFSDDDFAAGPGYLVADGQLFYQSGPGTTENLGLLLLTP